MTKSVCNLHWSLSVLFTLGVCIDGKTFVDLSWSINENTTVFWPLYRKYERFIDREKGGVNDWTADYSYTLSEHTSTHIDAPYHSYKTAWKLDEIDNGRLLGVNGFNVDLSHKVLNNGNYAIRRQDFLDWEAKFGRIAVDSVVLIRTGWDAKYRNKEDYLGKNYQNKIFSFPGIDESAANFLCCERFVVGVGIDVMSLDPGFVIHYPSHSILASKNVYIIENLCNLRFVPPVGFTLYVFPVKLDRATGAPVRVFAVV